MFRKIREKINIFVAQSPRKAVLLGIMLLNVVFILIAAGIISALSNNLSGMTQSSFWVSLYRTITMILDAGCIESIISDVGKAGAVAAIVCVVVVLLGMIFFTGAVIGYVTNSISDFIESKNNGKNRLVISGHVVIINWNSRAVEIINEFLYEKKEVKVIVFVQDNKDEVEEEIQNRLEMTLLKESQQISEDTKGMPSLKKKIYTREHKLKNNITCIVRQGDVAAATDLDDICISKARAVIILDNEKDEYKASRIKDRGNTQIIKTLIQVSEISKGNSRQIILVEVADDWTEDLVYRIIDFKCEEDKEKIIPVSFNKLLGVTYSQIAVMPEINEVFDRLFSNKGLHFISCDAEAGFSEENENAYIEKHLCENCHSIPLAIMETVYGDKAFFLAASKSELEQKNECFTAKSGANLRKDPGFKQRSIIILGHNSNMDFLMKGFELIRKEYLRVCGKEELHIIMVDDEESLKSHGFYKQYPDVEVFNAGISDEKVIYQRIYDFYEHSPQETSVLILSDDMAENDEIDADALTYLIYIQEIIRRFEKEEPEFDRKKLDVIVEILNPKNEDIVKSYGADRVILSNRYLSHVLSQISMGEAVYELCAELLSYDTDDSQDYGKGIYIRDAKDFFEVLPGKCTADQLIRMVFYGGSENNRDILFGYIRNRTEYVFFSGDQRTFDVELQADDKLMLYG